MPASVSTSIQIASATPDSVLDSGTLTPTGSNKVLYALVGSGASTPNNVTSVKYASSSGTGGESFTQIGSTLSIGANLKSSLWRLIAPSASSGTVWAQWGGTDDERCIHCVAVQDTDQVTPNNTLASATGASSLPTVNATSVAGNLVLDFLWIISITGSPYTITVGSGQTSIQETENNTWGSPYECMGTSQESASGTSTTMDWTTSASTASLEWGIFALAVNQAAAGAGALLPRNSNRIAPYLHF